MNPERESGPGSAFSLALYGTLWRIFLPPVLTAERLGLLPRGWLARERAEAGPGFSAGEQPLWMHCASLGEAKGMWAVAEALPPGLPLLLTATTAAGADYLGRRCREAGTAFRRARIAPFDHPGLIRKFLAGGGIRGLCLYESDFWPNALAGCGDLGLPTAAVSMRMTESSLRWYRAFGGGLARLLDRMVWLQAQSAIDARRFSDLTSTPIRIGADLKTLSYLQPPGLPPEADASLEQVAPAMAGRRAFAFVSLHLRELRRILPVLPALQSRGRVCIFPRRSSEFQAFRTALLPLGFSPTSIGAAPEADHLLIDELGRVSELLPHCHTAFIGGSLFPPGCHNLWEPLVAGARIVLGPHYRHQESMVEELRARGLATVVEDASVLAHLPATGPGPAGARLAQARRDFLESAREAAGRALRDCREGIISTFFPSVPIPPKTAAGVAAKG